MRVRMCSAWSLDTFALRRLQNIPHAHLTRLAIYLLYVHTYGRFFLLSFHSSTSAPAENEDRDRNKKEGMEGESRAI